MKKIVFIIIFTFLANGGVIKEYNYNIDSPQERIDNYQNIEEDNSYIQIKFNNNYDTALEEAKNSKKYIFLIVTEQYCRWCEKLIDEVLQNIKVGSKLIENYVPIIADRNGYYPSYIGITGTPSVFIINPYNGRVVDSIIGYRDRYFYLNRLNSIPPLNR